MSSPAESCSNEKVGAETLHELLKQRGLNPADYPTSVLVDYEHGIVTFLLYTLTGKVAGYQTWNPAQPKAQGGDQFTQRYWTHVTRDGKYASNATYFGAERFDFSRGIVYLVEGVFDAVRLHSLGVNALAVLGKNPINLAGFFKALGMVVVGVLDGDEAGEDLAEYCDYVLRCPEGEDPGSMSLEDLASLLEC